MASYRLGGIKATHYQKQEFVYDILQAGGEANLFIAHALTFLTWREVQEIGYRTTTHLKRSDNAYDNRTEQGEADA
jgi:hypothetical protein